MATETYRIHPRPKETWISSDSILKMMNMNEQEQRKKLVSLMLEVERLKQDGKELDEVLKYIEDNRLVR